MTKIALITDTHYGVRNDSVVFLDHQKKFFDQVFFPTLKKHKIETIIHLGDLVDRRKYINFNTSAAMRKDFLEKLADYQCHIIVGNHDVLHRNTNEINALTELIVDRHNYIKIYTETTEIEVDGNKLLLVPWINAENELTTFERINASSAQLCFGHLELKGFEMNKGNVSEHGYDGNLLSKFDMVFSGHFHRKSSKGNIFYLGAPYEMTWADFDCPRGFHILDLSKRQLKYFDNPYKIFTKITYDDNNQQLDQLIEQLSTYKITDCFCKVIVNTKNNPYWFDLFIDKIQQMSPFDLKIVDQPTLSTINSEIDHGQDTLTIINDVVDQTELSVDKKQLKVIFEQLYKQSLSLET